MIRKYVYGTPLPTGAIVQEVPVSTDALPYFAVEKTEEGLAFSLSLEKKDQIFGLGESLRGINKRGYVYRSWNSDDPVHTEDKQSLYASHNLLLFFGETKCFGVYFDDPGAVTFDLAYTRTDLVRVISENGNLSVYVMEEETLTAICRAFRQLTGRSYLPPKWALGYIQSRWGYASAEDARRVTAEHRKRGIPLDAICMDIDYMEDYKDFTWDEKLIPDLRGLNKELADNHVRLVPIIDAGIKQQEGFDVYDEGHEKGYFVKRADGTDFVGGVWPGDSCFPDFLREEVRAWFGRQYHRLMETGIEGFWNDMNEPALFYSTEGLQKLKDDAATLLAEEAPLSKWGTFCRPLNNQKEDYQRFYHTVEGQQIRHDQVHNLYGAHMAYAADAGFRSFDANKRFLLFSRSSFVGSHRVGGVWQGDNCAWWSHILQNLRMMPSLNMAGYLYTGADLGGFGCNTTGDLVLRWLQLGAFTPLMRNHSALGTREQEVYRFDNWEDMKNVLSVRYALLPYLYSELMQNALTDGMMYRPLAFDYPGDSMACHTENQVMLGEGCMIAPVYEQNAVGRHVYLPEDMLMVRFRSSTDYDLQPMTAGHHWVDLQLNEMPLFIRRGHVVPLTAAAQCVEELDSTALTLLGWVDGDVQLSFYEDDGLEKDPVLSDHLTTVYVRVKDGKASAEGLGHTVDAQRLIVG